MKFLSAVILVLALSSCGGDDKEPKTQRLTYNLTYNNCSTGEHSFNSKLEMCKGLLDNERNNFCASNMRADKYKQEGCEELTGEKF